MQLVKFLQFASCLFLKLYLKITEIQTILSKAEERKLQDNARMNRLKQQMLYEESLLADKKYSVTAKEMMKIRAGPKKVIKDLKNDSDSD